MRLHTHSFVFLTIAVAHSYPAEWSCLLSLANILCPLAQMFAHPSHNAYYAMTLPCSENCIYFIQDCNLGTAQCFCEWQSRDIFSNKFRKEQPISTPVWSWPLQGPIGRKFVWAWATVLPFYRKALYKQETYICPSFIFALFAHRFIPAS